ncbi:MAG: DUF1501 domain-containing protein [Vitreoscilla sp.]|nr:DUF1501 domain-containing protein [Vitreoscilla sp.]
MTTPLSPTTRRAFLQRVSRLAVTGAAAPWALNFAALGEAAAAGASDYKALVCVFLYGGNDHSNTLVPYDNSSHGRYQSLRPTLAYARPSLASTVLVPSTVPLDATGAEREYALAPELAPLKALFDAGRMAPLLNVGTLIQPTTKAQYNAGTVPLPPKLFSHNDQQSVWQSGATEGAHSGWGGRLADLLLSGNDNATFSCVNVTNNAVFMTGHQAVQYQVGADGPQAVSGLAAPLFGSSAASDALRTLITQDRSHLFEAEYNRVTRRAIESEGALNAALAAAPVLTTVFPTNNSLARQLRFVARMISAAGSVGAKRQVFFVSLSGFDHHDSLNELHPALLGQLGSALSAFDAAMIELGVSDQVTAFTASDFGRTLTVNNDGSDHGWGGMQFVQGGAVNGQRYYGTPPVVAHDGIDDVGQGRLLPSTATEQVAATLGRWFGVSDSDLLTVLPNLANFNASQRFLGFV